MTDTKAETAATFHATALSLAGAEGEAGAEAACCRCGARSPATNRSATKNFEHFCHITGSEEMHYCGLFAAQSGGGETGNSIMQSRKLRCAVPKRHSACPQHRAPQPTAPCS